MANELNAPAHPTSVPVSISGQYIKDFSFESPNAPQIFAPGQGEPAVTMNVNIHTRGLAANAYEVMLVMKVEAKHQEKTAFISELAYAGIFNLPQVLEEQLRLFLLVEAPRILFPFARSIMTGAIREGGFAQIVINPIDFYALYLANKDQVGTMPTAGAA